MLDSLGAHFWKGKRRIAMDRFLLFFQRYILRKNYILMDLEFMLLDTLDRVRPASTFKKYDRLPDIENACKRVEEFEALHYQTGQIEK